MVGTERFELPISWSQTRRHNQTRPSPEKLGDFCFYLKNQKQILTLIVCEDSIIGGDIADIKIDGEMKPLKRK